jgi:hypothetical protein
VEIAAAAGGVVYLLAAVKKGYFRRGFRMGAERFRSPFLWFGVVYAILIFAIAEAAILTTPRPSP